MLSQLPGLAVIFAEKYKKSKMVQCGCSPFPIHIEFCCAKEEELRALGAALPLKQKVGGTNS